MIYREVAEFITRVAAPPYHTDNQVVNEAALEALWLTAQYH